MGNATPKPPEPPEMDKDILEVYLGNTQPALGQMGFGGVMGYCSGLAFRKAGKLVGVVVGIGFIGAQLAASSGYVEVNWDKISKDAIKPWDTNESGTLDAEDAQVYWNKTKALLTEKVPSAGGFSAGFLLGARRG